MTPDERRLFDATVDGCSIRLDCTAAWLAAHAADLSLCGITVSPPDDGSAGGAGVILPTAAEPLTARGVELLAPFLADEDTPAGLCLEWGTLPLDDALVKAALIEAEAPGFRPYHGRIHRWGRYEGSLADVLTAGPDSRTTTVFDPRITQFSMTPGGSRVGLHIDNSLNASGRGERFPRAVRVAAADRRLLVNIGPGERRLILALNTTALHVSQHASPDDGSNIPNSRQLHAYLRQVPARIDETVCLVVRLAPGGYVVFPAAIAIHDGSTLGSSEGSRAIVLLGALPRRTEDG